MSSAASYDQSTAMNLMSEEASTSALSAAPVILDESRVLASNVSSIGFYSEISTPSSAKKDPSQARIHLNTAYPLTALLCGAQNSGKTTTLRHLLNSDMSGTNPCAELVVCWDAREYLPDQNPGMQENLPGPINYTHFTVSTSKFPVSRDVQGVHAIQIPPSVVTEEMVLEMLGISETHPYYRDLMVLMYAGQGWSYTALRARVLSQQGSHLAWLIPRWTLFDALIADEDETAMVLSLYTIPNSRTIIDLEGIPHRVAAVVIKYMMLSFQRLDIRCRKVIALDGCEHLLSDKSASELLMPFMVKLARTGVNQGLSIILSTQDPTAVPAEFLSACGLIVMHLMWSPSWMQYIAMHTAPVDHQLCAEVAKLPIGHAIISCPRAVRLFASPNGSRQVSPPIGWEHLRVQSTASYPSTHSSQATTGVTTVTVAPLTPSSAGTNVVEDKDHFATPAPPGLIRVSTPSKRHKRGETREATPIIPFNEDIPDEASGARHSDSLNIKHLHQPSGDDNWLGLAAQHYGSPSLSGRRSPHIRPLDSADSSSDEVLIGVITQPEPEPDSDDKPPEETIVFARTRAISPPFSTLANVDGETNDAPVEQARRPAVSAHQIPLVRMLRSQRAEGRPKTTCSFIGTILRREKHSWIGRNWSLEDYINKAALKGIITVVWNESGSDGWVTLSEFGRHVELPDAPQSSKAAVPIKVAKYHGKRARFAPLRGLFQSEDGKLEHINGGIVGELRRSHPNLIPEGPGEVRKYIEEAITAGVVEYARERKEWLKLV